MSGRNWQIRRLGSIVTLQRGFDITKAEQTPGPYLVITSSGPTSSHAHFKVKGPGVVIGRKGSLGTAFYVESDFWPHDTTLWVRDFRGNNPHFCYYYYLLKSLHLENFDVGSSNPTLNRNHVHLLELRCPPREEQDRIAAILSAYDDLIENNTRSIAILKEMARRLFEEWFVKFRFPGHEQTPLVGSALGPRPDGWQVLPLGEALTLQRGFDLPTNARQPGQFPVFAATGLHGNHSEARVHGPGVVTGRSGSLGTVILVQEDFWPLNTTLWVKNFKLVSVPFAYLLLSSLDLRSQNAGAAVPTLNRNHVHALPVTIPPRPLLDASINTRGPYCSSLGRLVDRATH